MNTKANRIFCITAIATIFTTYFISKKIKFANPNSYSVSSTTILNYFPFIPFLMTDSGEIQELTPKDDFIQPRKCFSTSWEEIISPCKDLMFWEQRVEDRTLATNLSNSEIKIKMRPPGQLSYVHIASVDNLKRNKTTGGDFYWVKITGNISFIVQIRDNMDGSYEGHFELYEVGSYTVMVVLEYSLCDGLRDPPKWWFIKGTTNGKSQPNGLLGYDDYLDQRRKFTFSVQMSSNDIGSTSKRKTITTKSAKQENICTPINNGCGYWKQKFISIPPRNYSTKKFVKSDGTLWLYGDSIQHALYIDLTKHGLCKYRYACRHTYNHVYPWDRATTKIHDGKDFNKTKWLESIENVFASPSMQKNSSILFLNFGLHMMASLSFEQTKDLIHSFLYLIKNLKIKYKDFPKIIWKTTTVPYEREYLKRIREKVRDFVRFTVKQRVVLWNAYSNAVMCKAGIPIIDVYNLAASYGPGPYDAVHFRDEVFETVKQTLQEYLT